MATFDALLKIGAKVSGTGDVKALTVAIGGLDRASSGLGRLASALTGVGAALGAGLGVAGLAMAAKGVIDLGDNLDELSQRTGANIETLSKLGLAAQQSGSNIEQVSGGLFKLSRNLGDIATGGGENAKKALSDLGVSAFDASGKLRTADEVMLDVADKFAAMEDGAMKATLAADLFGKGGAALVPMLNMGSDAIERLNTGMSATFAKNAGVYNDRLEALKARVSGLGAAIVAQLLPALIRATDFTIAMVDRISQWFQKNKDGIVEFGADLIRTGKKILEIAIPLAAGVAAFKLFTATIQVAQTALKAFIILQSMTPIGLAAATLGLGLGLALVGKATVEIEKIKKNMPDIGKEIETVSGVSAGFAAAMAAAGDATMSTADATGALANQKKAQLAIEKEMLEAQRQAVAYMDFQFQQVEKINSLAAAKAERIRDVAQQTLSVEQAQIDVARAILDGKLSMATSDEERLAITRQIADLDRQAAQANYAAAMAQIEAEQQLEKIRVINAENNFRRARAAYDIALKLGTLTNEIVAKLETARGDLMASAAQNVASDTSIAAKATVAGLNLQAANIRADNAVSQSISNNRQPAYYIETPQGRIPQFAMGAYVKGPTLALIGEGGEGESVVPDSKRVGFAMNVLRGMTGAAAIPAFAKGGYIAGENPANRGWQSSIGTSAFAGATETRNGMTYTFDPFGTIRLQQAIASASQAKKNASGKGGLSETEKNQIIRSMGGEITPFGGFRMNAPKNAWFTNDSPKSTTSASRTVNVTTSINAQPVAPDMFLVNGDEVRRMALEVAQQAIGQNNAQQRQPSARRRAGVR